VDHESNLVQAPFLEPVVLLLPLQILLLVWEEALILRVGWLVHRVQVPLQLLLVLLVILLRVPQGILEEVQWRAEEMVVVVGANGEGKK
jgi:hypothetical protein